MREILFRGKRTDNGQWVEGFLMKWKSFVEREYQEVTAIYHYNSSSPFLVIPETVGQFTGLTDKNGVKIFEGDIVKLDSDLFMAEKEVVGFIGVVKFIESCFYVENKYQGYQLWSDWYYLEVIGNIHDNAELL